MGIFNSQFDTEQKAIPSPMETFVDRYELIRAFVEKINTDVTENKVNVLFGPSGTGKSLLMRFIFNRCTVLFEKESWDYVKELSNAEFVGNVINAEGCKKIPVALIEFGLKGPFGGDLTDPFLALLALRNTLKQQGVSLFAFDFACYWYLYKTKSLNSDTVKKLYPTEEAGFITSIIDAVSETPYAKIANAFLQIINKRYKENIYLKYMGQKLAEDLMIAIQNKDPENELYYDLPELFALDINNIIKRREFSKIIICFDAHDQFWGDKLDSYSEGLFFQRDEWLRKLIGYLHLDKGVVVYLTATEKPKWPKANRFTIPEAYMDMSEVKGFTTDVARLYLEVKGITQTVTVDYMVENSSTDEETHPLCLAMISDLFLRSDLETTHELQFDKILEEQDVLRTKLAVVDRILKHTSKDISIAIHSLATVRYFDYEIYKYLGAEIGFTNTYSRYETITSYSFIKSAENNNFCVHDFIRVNVAIPENLVAKKTIIAMRKYYEEQLKSSKIKDPDYISLLVEQIYYLNREDWGHGFNLWHEAVTTFVHTGMLQSAKQLTDLHKTLIIEDSAARGLAAEAIAGFLISTGKIVEGIEYYNQALEDYAVVVTKENSVGHDFCRLALCHIKIAETSILLDRTRCASEHYLLAISNLKEALIKDPSHFHAYKNLGSAYNGLSIVYWNLGEQQASIENSKTSLMYHKLAIEKEPEAPEYYVHLAISLTHIKSTINEKDKEDYCNKYNEIVSTLNKALKIDRFHTDAIRLMANTYYDMARYVNKDQPDDAIMLVKESIKLYDALLNISPDFLEVLVTKTAVLRLHYSQLLGKGQNKSAYALLETHLVNLKIQQNNFPSKITLLLSVFDTLKMLTSLQIHKGKPEKCLKYILDAELIVHQLINLVDQIYFPKICRRSFNLAKQCDAAKYYEKAEQWYVTAERFGRSMLNMYGVGAKPEHYVTYNSILIGLLEFLNTHKEQSTIFMLHEDIISSLNASNDEHENIILKVIVNAQFGEIFGEHQIHDRAVNAFTTALQDIEKIKESTRDISYLITKGNLFLSAARYASNFPTDLIDVEGTFKKAYEVGKSLAKKTMPFAIYYERATYYYATFLAHRKKYKEACHYFKDIVDNYNYDDINNQDIHLQYIFALSLKWLAQCSKEIDSTFNLTSIMHKALDIIERLINNKTFCPEILYECSMIENDIGCELVASNKLDATKFFKKAYEHVQAFLRVNADASGHELLANISENLSGLEEDKGDFRRASEYANTAIQQLEILLKYAPDNIDLKNRMASRLIKLAEYGLDRATSAKTLKLAYQLYKEICDSSPAIEMYRNLCRSLAISANYQQDVVFELQVIDTCIESCKNALLQFEEDVEINKILCEVYLNKGEVLLEVNRDSSIAYTVFGLAHEVAVGIINLAPSDPHPWSVAANAQKHHGEILSLHQLFPEALECYEHAVQNYQMSINLQPDCNPAILWRAHAIRRAGETNIEIGNFDEAAKQLYKAIAAYEEITSKPGSGDSSNGLAISFLNLSQISYKTGELADAVTHANKSIDIFKECKRRNILNHTSSFNLGNAYLLLGNILYVSGNSVKAIEAIREATSNYRQTIREARVHNPAEHQLAVAQKLLLEYSSGAIS